MRTINLNGHSGCEILLCEYDDGTKFVRKISSGEEYNNRLKSQCDKQATFCSNGIFVPKVIHQGKNSKGQFFFDMEYVRGVTLSQYIRSISVSNIKNIVNDIMKATIREYKKTNLNVQNIFLKKIYDTELKVKKAHWNKYLSDSFYLLYNHSWSLFVESPCHGDLTLENIIISGDKLYYIDFLDSFYDSWLLDAGKLLQDVQAMWSYRFEKSLDINTAIRLHIFRDLLLNYIISYRSELYIEIQYALLLHLIRIYPYTQDEYTLKFLDTKVQMTIHNILNHSTQICKGKKI